MTLLRGFWSEYILMRWCSSKDLCWSLKCGVVGEVLRCWVVLLEIEERRCRSCKETTRTVSKMSWFPWSWRLQSICERSLFPHLNKLHLKTLSICSLTNSLPQIRLTSWGRALIPNISQWPAQTGGLHRYLLPMNWIRTIDTVSQDFS
jgi:hypothetical protein